MSRLPAIRWPQVLAAALVFTGAALVALLIHSFEPEPLSERQIAATRQNYLANCGEGMFDVTPQAAVCPAFDVIELTLPACPGCDAGLLRLQADGRAIWEQGAHTLQAGMAPADFRRLANLVAALQFDRLGGFSEPAVGAGGEVIRAGCGGQWAFEVNQGATDAEFAAASRCLRAAKDRLDWSQR